MGGPFSSYIDATHPSTPALLGHAIADQIQAAHAKGLADELVDRQKLVDQFQEIERDQSYDAKAREAARNYAFQLKFLPPTDKRPKQFQIDKDGRVPALVDITYRKAMRDGPVEPSEPAEPQDPMAGGRGSDGGSSAGGPPASISAMPDLGLGALGGMGGTSGAAGMSEGSQAGEGGQPSVPGRISPSPMIPPPPSINAAAGGMVGMVGGQSFGIPPPPPLPAGITLPATTGQPPADMAASIDPSLAAGQPPDTVSTRLSPVDMARQQANVKAIESMIPISREQATELGVHGAPDWPGMPGMVAVHPKALEGTRYSLDRQARMVAQGIDPATMERLPWKVQADDALVQLKQAQTDGQHLINAGRPAEAAALMMRANAAMITAEAARKHAQYNPYSMFGDVEGDAGSGGGGVGANGAGSSSGMGSAAGHVDASTGSTGSAGRSTSPSTSTPTLAGRIGMGAGIGIVAGKKVPPAVAGDVEDVLSGRNTLFNIRQTMGRSNAAAAYMQQMRSAIRAIDPKFDFVASDSGGKFASGEFYNRAISAITSVEPNISRAVDLSNQVSRLGVAAVDKMLQSGQIQFGNVKVANFHEAQRLIADEIGLALGQGTVSDMKLQLGFDITDPSLSAEAFASNMEIVREFIQNRKKALTERRYASGVTGPGYDMAGGGSAGNGGSEVPPPPAKRVDGETLWTDQQGVKRVWVNGRWHKVIK